MKRVLDLHLFLNLHHCDAKMDNVMLKKSSIADCNRLPLTLEKQSKMLRINDSPMECFIIDSEKMVFIDPVSLESQTKRYPCGTRLSSCSDSYKITVEWYQYFDYLEGAPKPSKFAPLHRRILWEMGQILKGIPTVWDYTIENEKLEIMIKRLERLKLF